MQIGTRFVSFIFLGSITSSTHSTRRYGFEIHNNLNLLRSASIEVDKPTYQRQLKRFIQAVQTGKRSMISNASRSAKDAIFRKKDECVTTRSDICLSLGLDSIHLYKSCYISNVRFNSMSDGNKSQSSDCCLLFNLGGKLQIGFINSIIQIHGKKALFRMRLVSIKDKVRVKLTNHRIACGNVFYGGIDSFNEFVYITFDDVVEKLIYVYEKKLQSYIFFKVPNLLESS